MSLLSLVILLHGSLCNHYSSSSDNGFKHVHIHVGGQLKEYRPQDIQTIRETVVEILECDDEAVVIDGFCHSHSFFIVLGIREALVKKMPNMSQQNKERLNVLNVDCFHIDEDKYSTESLFQGRKSIPINL
jgi:hypothetical protein